MKPRKPGKKKFAQIRKRLQKPRQADWTRIHLDSLWSDPGIEYFSELEPDSDWQWWMPNSKSFVLNLEFDPNSNIIESPTQTRFFSTWHEREAFEAGLNAAIHETDEIPEVPPQYFDEAREEYISGFEAGEGYLRLDTSQTDPVSEQFKKLNITHAWRTVVRVIRDLLTTCMSTELAEQWESLAKFPKMRDRLDYHWWSIFFSKVEDYGGRGWRCPESVQQNFYNLRTTIDIWPEASPQEKTSIKNNEWAGVTVSAALAYLMHFFPDMTEADSSFWRRLVGFIHRLNPHI